MYFETRSSSVWTASVESALRRSDASRRSRRRHSTLMPTRLDTLRVFNDCEKMKFTICRIDSGISDSGTFLLQASLYPSMHVSSHLECKLKELLIIALTKYESSFRSNSGPDLSA